MEPLSIAALSSMTPGEWERVFFDDRLHEVRYDIPTDAVCISTECYTSKRAYQIACEFRRRGVPVILGGFHVTLVPDEASEYADAIVIGEAENSWGGVLNDLLNHSLKKIYRSSGRVNIQFADRAIFGERDYGPLALMETSRGCQFHCEFCSITEFFHQTYNPRPVEDVVREIQSLKKRILFFVDDNLAMDSERLKLLCRAMIPLNKRWIGQLSIHAANDMELLGLMKQSGCAGVLIGFESLSTETLTDMGKKVNTKEDFSQAVENLRQFGLSVYATFVFGYEHDTEEAFFKTLEFALKSKFFFAAFNHLVPFPGTRVYQRLKHEGRLLKPQWWLDDSVRFGDVVFKPAQLTPERLSELCLEYRKKFYSFRSIVARGLDFRANSHDPLKMIYYFLSNFGQRLEISRRHGLQNGDIE